MQDQFIELENELINKNSINHISKVKRDPQNISFSERSDNPSKLKDCISINFGYNRYSQNYWACEGSDDYIKLLKLFSKK